MADSDADWLTLAEAAVRAGCSTKTLYRLMDRGRLTYRRGGDNRRYLREPDVLALFPRPRRQPDRGSPTDFVALEKAVHAMTEILAHQTRLLERAISLYQPKTLEQLINKRWAKDDSND